jgi:hypothetical protein
VGFGLLTPGLVLWNTCYCGTTKREITVRILSFLMVVAGRCFLAAAVLPQDTLLIRAMGVYKAGMMAYMLIDHADKAVIVMACHRSHRSTWHECADDAAIELVGVLSYLILTVAYMRTLCMPDRKAIDTLWRLMGWMMAAWAFRDALRITAGSLPSIFDGWHGRGFNGHGSNGHPIWEFSLYFLIDIACMGIFLSPRTREHVQAVLSRQGHEVNVASLIAGFLGGSADEEGVRKDSQRFFRYIFLSDLTYADMVAAKAGTRSQDIFQRSQPALLGEIDAFISHSWHDDATAKWEALQTWCKDFRRKHGREPKVWLDFCCIDQSNIEASLRCLPVYLSGCRELLVIAGPTYVQRLWCAIELFVFVSIHGTTEGYEDVPLEMLVLGQTAEEHSSVRATFTNFDALACECFDPEDKQRLLGVVEAGSGTMDRFNMQVRGMMDKLRQMGDGHDSSWTSKLKAFSRGSSRGVQETV